MILIDDLPSELDADRLQHAIDCFSGGGQLFITSVSPIDEKLNHGYHFEVVAGDIRRTH
jgi:recombinational DNA repair ATPase RecF